MDSGAVPNIASDSADLKPSQAKSREAGDGNDASTTATTTLTASGKPKQRSRRKKQVEEDEDDTSKRRCVSTACIACRKRKSKCDGNLPACAACCQVYGTDCIYDPNSDHRRKGVYKNAEQDGLDKTRNSTLHTLIQAILNYSEEDVPALVREIRTCESLDDVAEKVDAKENGEDVEDDEDTYPDIPGAGAVQAPTFETKLYGKMGELRLDDGSVRYIGGTSNLIHLSAEDGVAPKVDEYNQQENPITSWTSVTDDAELVVHLLNMYFTWHYTFFTTLSKTLFYRDFMLGKPPPNNRRKTEYCTPLLVNAVLALGCHFTSHAGGRDVPEDSATAGDHFFREAKRLIMENDEHEKPKLTTVQALALMSVREAGCGREAKGWVYSGMSFRMACDMGLNLDSGQLSSNKHANPDEAEEDARRITFWGCFLFDKCWSNYLGRLPQLPRPMITAPKPEVFPDEDSSSWAPYTDSGFTQSLSQPARTRAVALQITKLCEISNDLMGHFYNPSDMEKTKGKQAELKKLSDIHTRLEAWRRDLPKELEPREGGLSSVLTMHMFFQILFIHLFRPFLKYTQATSPLPQNVSPRKLCTQAAAMISKLLRLYKRSHGLRQICNIAVYIAHSACTIHLLNLPEKNARRDITHGVKHLEEIAEGWLCARRTLGILSLLARKWAVQLPDEAAVVLARTDAKFGPFNAEMTSPDVKRNTYSTPFNPSQLDANSAWRNANSIPPMSSYLTPTSVPMQAPTSSNNTASSGALRPHSQHTNYPLPPGDANTLGASIPPSATNTPQTTHQHQSTPPHSAKHHASPSDMFGGVEQLLRDSQEWAYREQASYAAGFENWQAPLEFSPATWGEDAATAAGAAGGGMVGNPGAPHGMGLPTAGLQAPDSASIGAMPPGSAGFVPSTSAGFALGGMGAVGGTAAGMGRQRVVNGLQPWNVMNALEYDEDAWYQ